ncbi:unnamed protein product [Rhodiola kirilowii]
MGNPNDQQVQCALVAEQYEDIEATKTTSQVAPEPELEPATEEGDQEPVADPVSEALKEGNKEDEPAGEVLVPETPANEKGVPTVDEILEKMNGVDIEKEKEVDMQDAAAEVLDEKSGEEVKAKAAVEEDEAEK